MRPDIAIIYERGFPDHLFKKIPSTINHSGLTILVEEREPSGPLAGIIWMMFSAAVVYIGKSYFDGFLKEMGKDNYLSVKNKLSNLTKETMELPRIEPVLIGTSGKIEKNNQFSMGFSIYAEANNNKNFKLLIPKYQAKIDYEKITSEFFDFVEGYHRGIHLLSDIGFDEISQSRENIILVKFNHETEKIEWIDYRTSSKL